MASLVVSFWLLMLLMLMSSVANRL